MDKKIIIIISSLAAVISVLLIALIGSNCYWMIKVKNIEVKTAQEYAANLEYQRELTKSSIQTVTEETNHYMDINEQLQEENNALRKDINASLRDDKCANSDIPNDVRKRLYTAH